MNSKMMSSIFQKRSHDSRKRERWRDQRAKINFTLMCSSMIAWTATSGTMAYYNGLAIGTKWPATMVWLQEPSKITLFKINCNRQRHGSINKFNQLIESNRFLNFCAQSKLDNLPVNYSRQ